MKLIVCLDEENGMSFSGRRQSMDRVLRQQAMALAGGVLWMNSYSARQFSDFSEGIRVAEDFLARAPGDAWCFAELGDLAPYLPEATHVAVYRWNRLYPSDVRFPIEDFEARWHLLSTREFAGSSHERITEEVYAL